MSQVSDILQQTQLQQQQQPTRLAASNLVQQNTQQGTKTKNFGTMCAEIYKRREEDVDLHVKSSSDTNANHAIQVVANVTPYVKSMTDPLHSVRVSWG